MGSNLSPIGQSAILLIRTYQKVLSPLLGQRCRFYPSCSQYTLEAIQEWGLAKGTWLGMKRLSRCHPLNEGGFDPVPRRNGNTASETTSEQESAQENPTADPNLQAQPEDLSHPKKTEAALTTEATATPPKSSQP